MVKTFCESGSGATLHAPVQARPRDYRVVVAGCGLPCEHSLQQEADSLASGDLKAAARWADQAEWWSAEAFRQVMAASPLQPVAP